MGEDLVGIAYRILKQKIIECVYLPGSLLSAKRIAGELSMSRTPIQGAVILLERDGYVYSIEKRGVMVRELSLREFYEINEIVYCAMASALENVPDIHRAIDLARYDELLAACVQAKAEGAYITYSKQTLALFELIAAATNNRILLSSFQSLLDKYLRYFYYWWFSNPKKSKYSRLDLLTRVGEALHRGDRGGAVAVQRQFMLQSREMLKSLRPGPLY